MLSDKLTFFYFIFLGQTAYMAWKEYSKAKKVYSWASFDRHLIYSERIVIQGEIAYISGGAGNTFKIIL